VPVVICIFVIMYTHTLYLSLCVFVIMKTIRRGPWLCMLILVFHKQCRDGEKPCNSALHQYIAQVLVTKFQFVLLNRKDIHRGYLLILVSIHPCLTSSHPPSHWAWIGQYGVALRANHRSNTLGAKQGFDVAEGGHATWWSSCRPEGTRV
jgi:hypothetical protein